MYNIATIVFRDTDLKIIVLYPNRIMSHQFLWGSVLENFHGFISSGGTKW